MSVARSITIRLLTNESRFSALFADFVTGFWFSELDFQVSSLAPDDVGDFDYRNFPDFASLQSILDYRESKGYCNYLSLEVPLFDEAMLVSAEKLAIPDADYSSQYILTFMPGIGRRLVHADRYTDYGFYLQQLLPRLLAIGCEVCEINCRDYDY